MHPILALLLTLLLTWSIAVWALNRLSIHVARRRVALAMFWLTALSPLLALLVPALVWGIARGSPFAGFDLKLAFILVQAGVPATVATALSALWGSKALAFRAPAVTA